MLFLAVETSSRCGSVALFSGGTCLRETIFPEGLVHGREITVHFKAMLDAQGLRPASIQAVSLSMGPGSYTGLRVGVAAAKSLAFALRIPAVTESSLRVIAGNAASAVPMASGSGAPTRVLTVLDGRQQFLYAALFEVRASSAPDLEASVTRTVPDGVFNLESLLANSLETEGGHLAGPDRGSEKILVVGDGADLFFQKLSDRESPPTEPGQRVEGVSFALRRFVRGPREWDAPRARVLGLLTAGRVPAARFDLEEIHRLEPSYMRRTEAELKLSAGGKP